MKNHNIEKFFYGYTKNHRLRMYLIPVEYIPSIVLFKIYSHIVTEKYIYDFTHIKFISYSEWLHFFTYQINSISKKQIQSLNIPFPFCEFNFSYYGGNILKLSINNKFYNKITGTLKNL